MPSLQSVSVALPPYRFSRDEILSQANQWLAKSPQERRVFERFLTACRIEQRSFVLPLADIVALKGMKDRAECFATHGAPMAISAARCALAQQRIDPSKIDALIFTSCTGPLIPTLDTNVVNALELSPYILRLPFYQHGCAGGAAGLALAHQLAGTGQTVLLLALEICSLEFQRDDTSSDGLLGAALFADGAAATIVRPDSPGPTAPGELKFIAARSILLPNSQQLMGYDIEDHGTNLRLLKELPSELAKAAKREIPKFLADSKISEAQVAWWLFHPGGVKILEILEAEFGLSKVQTQFSWKVLAKYGNTSSASVLFVLHEFFESRSATAGEYVCMLGVGPGLTVQLLLFQVQ